jgi:hypothetical protein
MTRLHVLALAPVGAELAAVAGATLFAVTTIELAAGSSLRGWDRQVVPAARPAAWAEPAGWRVLVDLGGAGFLCVALFVAAAVYLVHRGSVRTVVVAGGWLVAIEAAIWLAKVVVGRTPPRSGADLVLAGGMSYPSGHAADAFALLLIAVSLATTPGNQLLECPHPRRGRRGRHRPAALSLAERRSCRLGARPHRGNLGPAGHPRPPSPPVKDGRP